MGKEAYNIPANASLSYSLPHLVTTVEIETHNEEQDQWEALPGEYGVQLSEAGQSRYLKFFEKLKNEFGMKGYFVVRSTNNFPSDCGLASSASSFAALTKACYEYSLANNLESLKDLGFAGVPEKDMSFLSSFSRQGSGSSCRSLFDSWAVWEQDHARAESFPYQNLLHLAVIAEEGKKEVSSSEAHQRVRSSLLMEGRTKRAEERLIKLSSALNEQNWEAAYEICWAEFWDMHALFETSNPSFGYMNPSSLEILEVVKGYWKSHNDGPLVTMDAGPNVHLLFRPDQREAFSNIKESLEAKFKVWGLS